MREASPGGYPVVTGIGPVILGIVPHGAQPRPRGAATDLRSATLDRWPRSKGASVQEVPFSHPLPHTRGSRSMNARLQTVNGVEFAVADLSLAAFGRHQMRLAEHEMPGLMALRREYAD